MVDRRLCVGSLLHISYDTYICIVHRSKCDGGASHSFRSSPSAAGRTFPERDKHECVGRSFVRARLIYERGSQVVGGSRNKYINVYNVNCGCVDGDF